MISFCSCCMTLIQTLYISIDCAEEMNGEERFTQGQFPNWTFVFSIKEYKTYSTNTSLLCLLYYAWVDGGCKELLELMPQHFYWINHTCEPILNTIFSGERHCQVSWKLISCLQRKAKLTHHILYLISRRVFAAA